MSRRTRPLAALSTAAVVVVACGQQEPGAFRPEGTSARELSVLFWVLVIAGGAVFVGVMVLLVWAALASRHDDAASDGSGVEAHRQRHERRSSRLVIGGGVVLPVVVLVPLTIMMLVVGNRLAPRLGDAYEIEVVGHQFWWEVVYPDAGVVTANEIHIPTNTRVRVNLTTADVIHSFWVPQLAGKIDMIPGETTEVLIDADRPGTFIGQCAEFCGVQHARMRFLVIAQPPDEFEQWLVEQAADAAEPETDAARQGAEVFTEVGCAACHTVRGTEADGVVGPDLTHLASRRTLGALTLPNRRGQLAGWITDPQASKPGNLMPPAPLSSEQLLDLLVYLEGLR
jgi:cytochrome c oxidase subunit II